MMSWCVHACECMCTFCARNFPERKRITAIQHRQQGSCLSKTSNRHKTRFGHRKNNIFKKLLRTRRKLAVDIKMSDGQFGCWRQTVCWTLSQILKFSIKKKLLWKEENTFSKERFEAFPITKCDKLTGLLQHNRPHSNKRSVRARAKTACREFSLMKINWFNWLYFVGNNKRAQNKRSSITLVFFPYPRSLRIVVWFQKLSGRYYNVKKLNLKWISFQLKYFSQLLPDR